VGTPAEQPERDGPKVLYVIGKGRSGSTLLDLILGELDGYVSTGQLDRIWTSGLIKGYDCGCGLPLPKCEVWTPILEDAFGGDVDPHAIARTQAEVLAWKHAPRVLRHAGRGPAGWPALERYVAIMSRLYAAIATITGARVIVDSSKAPAHPGSVGLVPGITPYVVHLVRDPRAVTYSWKRRKALQGRGEMKEMPRFGPVYSSVSWVARNVAARRNRRVLGRDRSIVLRYEDLAERPREAVERIARMVGEVPETLPFTDERTVELSPNHTVSGNPIRTNVGSIELRRDDEWRRRISTTDRVTASVLTYPVRKRYGY